jgi:hypothetical protein
MMTAPETIIATAIVSEMAAHWNVCSHGSNVG